MTESWLEFNKDRQICPDCHNDTTTEIVDYKFPYGHGVDQVELSATIPVRKCVSEKCGCQFLDWEAEDLIAKTVKEYEALSDSVKANYPRFSF